MAKITTAQQLEALMPDASQLLSDEPEMESSLHYMQLLLLVTCLEWLWREREDFFIGANLTIYFSRQQLRNRDFRGPDFFLVRSTEKRPRNSWVVWEEDGRYPDLIIELLSNSTANVDRTMKRTLYQNRFRTPEYFWFSPDTLEFEGFRLVEDQYEAIIPNQQGWRWSHILELYLGVADGQLRYFTPEGELVPTPEEAAEQIRQQVDLERQQAELAQRQADQARQQADQARQQAELARQQADLERQQADQARQQVELARQQADQARQQVDLERQQADQARQQVDLERQQADQARQQAELARQQADQARQQADQARQQAELAELQLAQEREEKAREQTRAEHLAQQLRSLGIDPEA